MVENDLQLVPPRSWPLRTGSVHLQDLGLREAKLGLMLVEELHQGFHVHGVVQVDVLLGRVLQLGDGNGLTHCREGAEASGKSVPFAPTSLGIHHDALSGDLVLRASHVPGIVLGVLHFRLSLSQVRRLGPRVMGKDLPKAT